MIEKFIPKNHLKKLLQNYFISFYIFEDFQTQNHSMSEFLYKLKYTTKKLRFIAKAR